MMKHDPDVNSSAFTQVGGTKFISRRAGLVLLYGDRWAERTRMRNYEIEGYLRDQYGGQVCISEWCPYDGRFCTLRDHIAAPHPPCSYESPPYHSATVGVPWNVFGGGQVSMHVRSDVVDDAVSSDLDIVTSYWPGSPETAADWKLPYKSLAVVACDGRGHGAVLYTVGPAVACEVENIGGRLDDIGLDDAPGGISVWAGFYRWHPGPRECPEDGDSELDGDFRDPTEDEWKAIAQQTCPWTIEDWRTGKYE